MSPMSSSDLRQAAHEQRLREAFHGRLAFIKAMLDLSQSDMSAGLWASSSTVSDWFNAERKALPEGIKMLRLPEVLPGVNFHWLITGEGEPTVTPTADEAAATGAIEAVTRLQLYLSDMKADLQGQRRARQSGATAVADVRREIARTGTPRPQKRGARRS